MVRIKHSVASHKRKKRVLQQTKGQFGHRKNRFRQAIKSLQKGLVYAYRDRKVKKRHFRELWITRINAAARLQARAERRWPMTDKEFLHSLWTKHYGPDSVQQRERAICISCGKPRVLGQRGEAKDKCKKCRKKEVQP